MSKFVHPLIFAKNKVHLIINIPNSFARVKRHLLMKERVLPFQVG